MGGKRYHAETRTETRAPARSAQVGSDVLVPLLQSGVLGVLVGLAFWSPKIGLVVWLAAYTVLLFDHRRLLWSVERVIGRDIDRDRSVGRPPPPQVITVNGNKAIRHAQEVRARQHAEDIVHFARVVWECQQNNLPTGQRALRGVQLTHSNVSDEFHRECGRLFVDNGLARADGTGWTLDAAPEDVREALRAG